MPTTETARILFVRRKKIESQSAQIQIDYQNTMVYKKKELDTIIVKKPWSIFKSIWHPPTRILNKKMSKGNLMTPMKHTCHWFSTLGDGMLSKFTREDESDGSLDFSRWDSGLLRVCGQFYKEIKNASDYNVMIVNGNLLDASVAIRSKMSLTKLLRIAIALLEIPVSGWTCLRTESTVMRTIRQINQIACQRTYPCRCKRSTSPF